MHTYYHHNPLPNACLLESTNMLEIPNFYHLIVCCVMRVNTMVIKFLISRTYTNMRNGLITAEVDPCAQKPVSFPYIEYPEVCRPL